MCPGKIRYVGEEERAQKLLRDFYEKITENDLPLDANVSLIEADTSLCVDSASVDIAVDEQTTEDQRQLAPGDEEAREETQQHYSDDERSEEVPGNPSTFTGRPTASA